MRPLNLFEDNMINATEREEREYLEEIKEKLLIAIKRVDDTVKEFSTELRKNKEYIYEHQSGMDEADMVAAGQSINRMAFTGESAVARKRKLLKLGESPYFGRIDFATGDDKACNLYRHLFLFGRNNTQRILSMIGVHRFRRCFMILN